MKPVAKAKKRQEEFDADEQAVKEYEGQIAKSVVREKGTNYRDEVSSREVVNIMADEIQVVYREMGAQIDDVNAQDKALTLWRDLHLHGKFHARQKEMLHKLCKEHS